MSFEDATEFNTVVNGNSAEGESIDGVSDTPLNFMNILSGVGEAVHAQAILNVVSPLNKIVLVVTLAAVNDSGSASGMVMRLKEGANVLGTKSQTISATTREIVFLVVLLDNVNTGNHTYEVTLERTGATTIYDAGTVLVAQELRIQ